MIVVADGGHCEKCQGQQHKDKCLNEADEQLQPIKDNGQQKCNEKCHDQQYHFTGKNIAEKPEGEADNFGNLGNQFKETDGRPMASLNGFLKNLLK